MVVPVKKKKGTVSNVPRKKKHKGKTSPAISTSKWRSKWFAPRDPYKKKEKGMGNNVPKKKNIKKR
jgi:hypothetical protein